jgi:hypothetical protein
VLQLPLVVLLEQDRADQPDDRSFVGEDADDVGAALDLLVEPFERVGAVQFAAVLFGEVEIGQHIGFALVDERRELWPFRPQLVGDMAQHGARLGPIRLQEGLAQRRCHRALLGFGDIPVSPRRLVATTDRVFSFATAEGRIADIVRTRIVPAIFPKVVAFEPVRDYIFRTVSQITLNYRGSPLSARSAGRVHGGDRPPWVREEGADNFSCLSKMAWQVHVYGVAKPELVRWCADRKVQLNVFRWTKQHEAAGLGRDALYLLRPDTYVALADTSGAPDAVDRYFARRGLRLTAQAATEPAHA